MSNHLNFAPIFKGLRLITGLVSLALLVFSGMTNAAPVTFTFQSTSGTWGSYSSTATYAPSFIQGVGTNDVRWGDAINSSSLQKSLIYDGNTNTAQVTPGSAFAIGWLTHANHAISADSNITSANLSLQLSLAGYDAVNFNYNFGISQGLETTDPQTSYADTLTFTPVGSTQFSLGSQAYSFELLGFYDMNNSNTYSTLIVPDTLTALQIPLYAKITAVPVPAALWLLGSGLLGLAGFAKRKRTPQ